jgi:hypothetical protein
MVHVISIYAVAFSLEPSAGFTRVGQASHHAPHGAEAKFVTTKRLILVWRFLFA